MRVPLSWLREYVDIELAPEALAERLTLLGMEVRGIEVIGSAWRSIVVGELLAVSPHPGSSRLSLTRVRTDDGSPVLSIVCGATNIAVGQRVPVALPGAALPGGREIGVTRIAGEESQGMLCSGDELRLTSDAEGILILPPESPLGAPLAQLFGDVVLDIDVKPNRGDALSMLGLAGEVSAATGATVRWPPTDPGETGDAVGGHVSVEVLDTRLCPRFVARYVDGLTVHPSPLRVQLRLTAAGMRPVSNVVDATNYVMLELGKPTHAFDAAAVHDGRLVVRLARPGERLETLDHVVRELDGETLVIADRRAPLAIAGVMGSATTEVSEGTSAAIIESAIFDPVSIRRTAQRHALRSEASLRFEKGQEHRLARLGADRVAHLLAAWAGGRVAAGVVDTDPAERPLARVPFRPGRIARLLGVPLEREESARLLARAGVATQPAAEGDAIPVVPGEPPLPLSAAERRDALVAIVPGHRRDMALEADIAEEIARIRGYETLPGRLPETEMPDYRPDPRRGIDEIRHLLSGRGLSEVVTHALIEPGEDALLGLPAGDPGSITISNPVSADHSVLRRSLLPGLVRTLADNERQRRDEVAVFEVGAVHEMSRGQPVQRDQLGILMAGAWRRRAWDEPGPQRAADVSDVKGLLEWLADRVAVARLRFERTEASPGVHHPGRTASVVIEGPSDESRAVGLVGELDPRYLAAHEVRAERVSFALVELAAPLQLAGERPSFRPVPTVPVVERDIAVVLDEHREAEEILAVIRATGGPMLRDISVFDRYEGPPLDRGEVSLACRLRLQPDRTLTDAEIEGIVGDVRAALRERLGARFRE